MSLHYFSALPKNKELDPEINNKVSKALAFRTFDALTPFYQCLNVSIKAYNKKEEIKAEWEPFIDLNSIKLEPLEDIRKVNFVSDIKIEIQKGLYRIENFSELDESEFNFEKKVEFKFETQAGEVEVDQNCLDKEKATIFLKGVSNTNFDKVRWGWNDLELKPAWKILTKESSLTIDGDNTDFKIIEHGHVRINRCITSDIKICIGGEQVNFEIIHADTIPEKVECIRLEKDYAVIQGKKPKYDYVEKIKNIADCCDPEKLLFESDNRPFNAEHVKNFTFRTKNNAEKIIDQTVVSHEGAKFIIKEDSQEDKGWILLKEPENDDKNEENSLGLSPLRYFFDDDINVEDDQGNRYKIIKGNESEARLILQSTGKKDGKNREKIKKPNKFNYPPKSAVLRVKVNTYQLRKQLEAVRTLQNMPIGKHVNLIRLFEDTEKVRWPHFKPENVNNWHVLTQKERDGCIEQREFVKKALASPDFVLLEGPPGSGKTTAILELICQGIKKGQRILLCGSTHVAIDNVLELLKEKMDGEEKSLIEKFSILPVRIGDLRRISDDVEEFQLNKQVGSHGTGENLLLESANLVCGTTIGILQHPKFKNRKGKDIFRTPIVPEFDMLIIDESSKTTFQEFLVPALYAKKWILVGDVMQLSPFTDRDQLVAAIENLEIKKNGKSDFINPSLQSACFILQKIEQHIKAFKNTPVVFCVTGEELKYIAKEFEKRFQEKKAYEGNEILIGFVTKSEINITCEKFYKFPPHKELLSICAMNLVFVEDTYLDDVRKKLPENFMILRDKNWLQSQHAFQHNYMQKRHKVESIYERGRERNGSFEIVKYLNRYFSEKSWAEEIAWRVDREHQLRLTKKGKSSGYSEQIEKFLPYTLNRQYVENRLNTVACVSLPSILECLIQGIKVRKAEWNSTISEGFKDQEKDLRRVTLEYQHRMHPQISDFPREQFYNGDIKGLNALIDLKSPEPIENMRKWNYNRYKKRRIWLNVKAGETIRNYNVKEADAMMKELKEFEEFANRNPKKDNQKWSVACLTFYRRQERELRENLRKYTKQDKSFSRFKKGNMNIYLHTVDKFQGHEADIVFLSMVQTYRDGFLDSPNRLNVAITRAKYQLVIIGKHDYFKERSRSYDLKALAQKTKIFKGRV
jgi:DNA polymerase III delta prime subunit